MLIDIIGWGGSLAILGAYALLSTGRLRAESLAYQGVNMAGALGMAVNGWAHGALPSVFNNLIWMGIGSAALLRLVGRRNPSGFGAATNASPPPGATIPSTGTAPDDGIGEAAERTLSA